MITTPAWIRSPQNLIHLATTLLLLSAFAVVLINLWVTFKLYLPVYFMDDWNHYSNYIEAGLGEHLISTRLGHSMVLPKLLYVFQAEFMAGTGPALIALGIALNALAAALLSLMLWQRSIQAPAWQRMLGAVIIFTAIFWMVRYSDYLRDLTIHNHLVVAFTVLACFVLVRYLDTLETKRSCLTNRWWLIMTAACIAASISFGTGMATWPALIFIMLLHRAPLNHLAWFTGIGIIVVGTIQFLLPESNVDHDMRLDPRIVTFIPEFLGNIWPLALIPSHIEADNLARFIAMAFGITGVILLLFATWRHFRTKQPDTGLAMPLALAWFALAISAMVFLGRSSETVAADHARLATWQVLFWVALGWLGLYQLMRAQLRPWLARGSLLIACAGFIGISGFTTFHLLPDRASLHDRVQSAGLILATAPRMHGRAAFTLHVFKPDLVLETLPHLEKHQRNIYAHAWHTELGKRFSSIYNVSTTEACSGNRQMRTRPADGKVAIYEGQARHTGNHVITRLVFVYEDTVVGVGIPAYHAGWPDILARYPRSWTGVVNMDYASSTSTSPHEATAYGVLADGVTACRVTLPW